MPTRRIALLLAAAVLSLPVPVQPASADAVSGATMLSWHNSFRAAIGAPAVAAEARVERAAQAHADYLSFHNQLGHYETITTSPYYTGYSARDRVAFQSYNASFVSENAASYSNASQAVNELWHAPYHRLGMMHPHTVQAGWGHSSISGRERTVGNFIKNFSSPAPDFVRSPAHGQTDIPTSWNGNESPSPLPAGAAKPTGYPVMVVYSRYQVVQMRSATITGPAGAVPIYYAPQQFETDYQAVIPQQPLASGTTYHVRFDLTVDGRAVTNEWDFTTAGVRPWNAAWVSDNTPTRIEGASVPVTVTLRNTGANTWPAANVRLSYHWVNEATGATAVWDGNRGTLPADVARNQQVTVPITVSAPSTPGRYRLEYDLVYEGQFWFSWRGLATLNKTVTVGDFRATYAPPASIVLGTHEEGTVVVTITNTGSATWRPNGTPALNLSSHLYSETGAVIQYDGPRAPLPNDVAPGQSAAVQVRLRAPATAGTYRAEFDLVYEGFTWFSWQGTATGRSTVTVQTYGAAYAPGTPGIIAPGTPATVPVTLTNTGSRTWSPPTFNLSYHLLDSAGRIVVWDGLRTSLPQAVLPGQSVTVEASFTLPAAGSYTVQWDMVQDGVTWFSWRGVPVGTSRVATAPEYGATYAVPGPQSATSGQTLTVPVTVTNTGWRSWSTGAFRLSYHIYDGAGHVVVWDGARTALPQSVAPGASLTVQASIAVPAPGSYTVRWDMVHEGVAWFSWRGVATATTPLTAR